MTNKTRFTTEIDGVTFHVSFRVVGPAGPVLDDVEITDLEAYTNDDVVEILPPKLYEKLESECFQNLPPVIDGREADDLQ